MEDRAMTPEQAGDATARETSDADQALNRLSMEQDNVRQLVRVLEERLDAVLRPPVSEPPRDEEAEVESAPLVHALRDRREFERGTRDAIEYLLSRLAV